MSCLASVRQDAERSLRQRRGVRREGQPQHWFPWCPLSSVLAGFLTPGHLACKSQSAPLFSLFFPLPPATCLALSLQVPAQQPLLHMGACTCAWGCAHACVCPNKQKKPGLACSTTGCRARLPAPPGEGRLGWWDVSEETSDIAQQPFL